MLTGVILDSYLNGKLEMEILYKNLTIEAIIGDIANQPDVVAVVNAANAELTTGGGVAGAIHRSAGPELYKECKSLAPIKPGEAVITNGYGLPNIYIIHCLGPVYGRDKPEEELLESCYTRAIQLAEENKISSIAFPAISTGAFGYPFKQATQIALQTILKVAGSLKHLQKIKFVLHSEKDLKVYLDHLSDMNT